MSFPAASQVTILHNFRARNVMQDFSKEYMYIYNIHKSVLENRVWGASQCCSQTGLFHNAQTRDMKENVGLFSLHG